MFWAVTANQDEGPVGVASGEWREASQGESFTGVRGFRLATLHLPLATPLRLRPRPADNPPKNTGGTPMSSAPLLEHEEQTVVFQLGKESYGIDVFRVTEIIRLREITAIPRTESHIRGLVNLRGKTIPVVDLRARFSLEASDDDDATRIIVIDTEQGNVGIVVDAVREVVTLTPDEVEAAPAMVGSSGDSDFVRGVARSEGRLITLLDLDQALAA